MEKGQIDRIVRRVGLDPAVFFAKINAAAYKDKLRATTDAYRDKSWRIVEAAIAPRPWFLGTRFSALDVYAKVMTHWRPRRDWFKDNCPKLMSVALAADKEPRLAKVWQRNFP